VVGRLLGFHHLAIVVLELLGWFDDVWHTEGVIRSGGFMTSVRDKKNFGGKQGLLSAKGQRRISRRLVAEGGAWTPSRGSW